MMKEKRERVEKTGEYNIHFPTRPVCSLGADKVTRLLQMLQKEEMQWPLQEQEVSIAIIRFKILSRQRNV